MTDKEKAIFVRGLLALNRLFRSKKDTTARRYAEEVADSISKLMEMRDAANR